MYYEYKEYFYSYFLSDMKSYQQMNWISNPFQEQNITNRISARVEAELIEIFEDYSLKFESIWSISGNLFKILIQHFLLKQWRCYFY